MQYYNVLLLLMILNIGCSSTSGEKLVRGSRYVIIQEEIEHSGMGMTTAYDVIRFLRPTLMERSSRRDLSLLHVQNDGTIIPIEDSVYLDGVYLGKVQSLFSIPTEMIGEIQYLKPSEAQIQYGVSEGGGVFKISTKQFKSQF